MKELAQLVQIGEKAVQHQQCQQETSNAKSELRAAYTKWKNDHGIGYIECDTDDWTEMMEATTPEFKAYRKALASQGNAKQRLKRATMAYLLAN